MIWNAGLVRLSQAPDLTERDAVAGRADVAGVDKAQFSSGSG